MILQYIFSMATSTNLFARLLLFCVSVQCELHRPSSTDWLRRSCQSRASGPMMTLEPALIYMKLYPQHLGKQAQNVETRAKGKTA